LASLVCAVAVSVLGASGSHTVSGRLGGDYPAFDGAGRIVAAGDGADLYDPVVQAESQRGLYGGETDGGYLPFAYPPHVALPYSVLSAVGYRWSYAFHVLGMVVALLAALALLRPLLWRRADPAIVVAVALVAYPVFRGVTAGQNVAFALLLVAASWRAVEADHHVVAGVALGLLAYKPQLAVGLLAVHAVARRWRVLGGAAVGVGVSYLASAAVAGWGWVPTWWSAARRFAEADLDVDGPNAISWAGVVHAIGAPGAVTVVAVGLTIAAVGLVAWRCRGDASTTLPTATALAAGLLVSPHTLFYDAALLSFVALAVGWRLGWPATFRRAVLVVAAVTWVHLGADAIGVSPLVPLVVAAAVVAGRLATADVPRPTRR